MQKSWPNGSSKTARERRLLLPLLPLALKTVGSNNHSGNYGAGTRCSLARAEARNTSAKTRIVILVHDAEHSTTKAYSEAAIRSPKINVPPAARAQERKALAKCGWCLGNIGAGSMGACPPVQKRSRDGSA